MLDDCPACGKKDSSDGEHFYRNMPKTKPIGLCFKWANQQALKHDNIIICHGIVTAPLSQPPRPYLHAWIEHNEVVQDWQTMVSNHGGKFMGIGYPRAVFYDLFKPTHIKKYMPTEITSCLLKYKHHGPWPK